MGNRGTLGPKHFALSQPHAPQKAWITCVISQNGVPLPKVDVKYSKLFFLDEVTAFAAGHRPCRQCQAQRYNLFDATWTKSFGKNATHFDEALQKDRCNEDGSKKTFQGLLSDLPSGVMIKRAAGEQPYLLLWGRLFPWSIEGYGKPITYSVRETVQVLTPASMISMLKAGFPLLVNNSETIHPSIFNYL
jgi:hypothetical protein